MGLYMKLSRFPPVFLAGKSRLAEGKIVGKESEDASVMKLEE